jgi:hypothetical protein
MLSYSAIQEVALGLLDLIDRPFFERQWILQEVALGKNVFAVWGDLRLSWATLLAANTFMNFAEFRPTLLGQYSAKNFRTKTRRVDDCQYMKNIFKTNPMDLWTVLKQCQFHKTAEANDKIYSLGIASDAGNVPRPDYSPSMSLCKVFQEFAVYFCQCNLGMDLINQVCSLGVHVPRDDYPSWTPWFSEMVSSDYPLNVGSFQAAGKSKPCITLTSDSDSLVSLGALIDKVKLAGPQGHPLSKHEYFTLARYKTWSLDSSKMLRNSANVSRVENALPDTVDDIGEATETLMPLLRRGTQAGAELELDWGLINAMTQTAYRINWRIRYYRMTKLHA